MRREKKKRNTIAAAGLLAALLFLTGIAVLVLRQKDREPEQAQETQLSGETDRAEEEAVDFPEVYPEEALEEATEEEIAAKVEALLTSMTEEEYYAMLGGSQSAASARGYGTGYVGGVPRLGVPVLRMWDGPKGVIGDGTLETTSPASPLALGASFDEDLAYEYGEMLGKENRATAGNVQLGVQIDNVRSPFFSRGRDMLGEDPYLTARMGERVSAGVQDEHVISTLKHFVGFSSQFQKGDSLQVDEQTLYEVYLAPFEYILKQKSASAVMLSYNKLNGTALTESPWILKTLLRDMWGFDGLVTVDWWGNDSLSVAYGLDLEMPVLQQNTEGNIEAAIAEGTMDFEDVREAVRHTLTAMGQAGYLGLVQVQADGTAAADADPPASIELPVLTGEERTELLEEDDETALQTALEGAVLLKNEDVLPLDETDDIALIGVLAEHTLNYYSESSYGWLQKMTGVREPLQEILGEDARIFVSTGIDLEGEPIDASCLYTSEDCTQQGVAVTVDGRTFTGDVLRMTAGTVDGEVNRSFKNADDGDALSYGSTVRMTTYLKAPKSGVYELQLLKIGGEVGVTIRTEQEISIAGSGSSRNWPITGAVATDEGMDIPTETTQVYLVKDQVYAITLEGQAQSQAKDLQFSLNWFQPGQRQEDRSEAVEAAASHDKVVYFAYDMGGGDRRAEDSAEKRNRISLELEERQTELLLSVIEAAKENGNQVIVVLDTALPVTMDWLSDVDAVLEMWMPGQSGGRATALLLTGEVNPSGKLPVTFPKDINDTQFGDAEENYCSEVVNVIDIDQGGEGIFYGYRWYEREGIEPLFAFGYGLSYTEFSYSDLEAEREADGYAVSFTVTNTGKVAGTEIAQVYLGAADVPEHIQMAEHKLAAFVRIEDLQPGEERRVSVHVDTRELSYWDPGKEADENGEKWTLAEGKRMICVGAASNDLRLQEEVDIQEP